MVRPRWSGNELRGWGHVWERSVELLGKGLTVAGGILDGSIGDMVRFD